jgi:hypothetical protein
MVRSHVPDLAGQSLANHAPESITAGLEPVWAAIPGFQPVSILAAGTKKFGAAYHRPEFNLMN